MNVFNNVLAGIVKTRDGWMVNFHFFSFLVDFLLLILFFHRTIQKAINVYSVLIIFPFVLEGIIVDFVVVLYVEIVLITMLRLMVKTNSFACVIIVTNYLVTKDSSTQETATTRNSQ